MVDKTSVVALGKLGLGVAAMATYVAVVGAVALTVSTSNAVKKLWTW